MPLLLFAAGHKGRSVQERVLFKYKASWGDWNWGSVLVTDQRVVLSGRTWDIAEIASAQLVTDRILTRRLSLTQPPPTAMMAGGALLFASWLLLVYLGISGTHSGLLTCLGLLLFFAAAGCIAYGAFNNYAEVYQLQLTLKDGRQQIADNLLWYPDDARSARRTVETITQALAAYHETDKP